MTLRDEAIRQAVEDYRVPSAHAIGLVDYKLHGRVPNGHLMKVLENDLFGAMKTAQASERAAIYDICVWIAVELPSQAYGSSNAMWNWVRNGGMRVDYE